MKLVKAVFGRYFIKIQILSFKFKPYMYICVYVHTCVYFGDLFILHAYAGYYLQVLEFRNFPDQVKG